VDDPENRTALGRVAIKDSAPVAVDSRDHRSAALSGSDPTPPASGGSWTDTLKAVSDPSLDPHFWRAERLGAPSAWQHVPFAHWIVCATAPRVLVELGTHTGVSYAAFCQAVARERLATRCHAVGTWRGDPHAGAYGPKVFDELRPFHDERFGAFSTLLQYTFDEALDHFEDGSIDLLHIDGLYTYQAVRHDFESWLPKLSTKAVVLFHDINERGGDFGVWRLWAEFCHQYPAFEFLHGHGLGVLAVGADAPVPVTALCKLVEPAAVAVIRTRFARLGERGWMDTLAQDTGQRTAVSSAEAEQLRAEVARYSTEAAASRTAAERARGDFRAAIARASQAEHDTAGLRTRAEQAEARAQLIEAEAGKAAARAAELGRALTQVQAERDSVLASTAWRATWLLRSAGSRLPRPARRALRGAAKLGWWSVTMKLPRKLRERQEARRTHCLIADDVGREPCPKVEQSRAVEESYQRWVRENDSLSDADRHDIQVHIGLLREKPLISVVMVAYETDETWLREAIASVRSQLYPYWELCVADDASCSPHVAAVLAAAAAADSRIKWVRRDDNGHIAEATNTALGLATGSFIALMDHDDLLAERALYEITVILNAHRDADLIYTDEDQIGDTDYRHTPYFKPEWNHDLFLGHNMVNHLGVYRRSLVERLGGLRVGFEGSQDYDLALRVVAETSSDRIHHIPAVLYHCRRTGDSSFSELHLDRCTDAARKAIAEHLLSMGGLAADAKVSPHPTIPGWNRIRWPLPAPPPRVSIIVPTRDRPDLLAQCAAGVLHRTDYPEIELIIVDNDSIEEETQILLRGLSRDPRVRVLPFAGEFNYSAINNGAVRQATGEVVVLLNNDTIVIGADWLREMISQVMRPKVGAVGAKLLYADDTVQHAGVALGTGSFDDGPGVAGHFGYRNTRHDPGYFGQNALTRELSACTGACLALRREVYQEVGGLDEEHLPVAYNDVDLCIRLRQSGYKIIWTPFAELYHLESASRGSDEAPNTAPRFRRDVEYMRARWGSVLANDPFYNPNFSRVDSNFSLGFPPLRAKPWRSPVLDVRAPEAMPKQSRSGILLAPIPKDQNPLRVDPGFENPQSGDT
jgi:O-antigen biosynthesis protein